MRVEKTQLRAKKTGTVSMIEPQTSRQQDEVPTDESNLWQPEIKSECSARIVNSLQSLRSII